VIEPRHLGTARDHDALVDLLRARKDDLGISDQFIDEACLSPGHCGKVLGPMRVKTLGRQSLDGLLIALGCALVLVEDPEHIAMMEAQWEKREAAKVHFPPRRVARSAIERIKPVIFSELARLGGAERARCLPGKHRRKIAQKAARARWRKARSAERQRA